MSNNHGVAERMVTTRARMRSEQTRLTIALTLLSQVWAGVSSSVLNEVRNKEPAGLFANKQRVYLQIFLGSLQFAY